jgi:hypothetical protein
LLRRAPAAEIPTRNGTLDQGSEAVRMPSRYSVLLMRGGTFTSSDVVHSHSRALLGALELALHTQFHGTRKDLGDMSRVLTPLCWKQGHAGGALHLLHLLREIAIAIFSISNDERKTL